MIHQLVEEHCLNLFYLFNLLPGSPLKQPCSYSFIRRNIYDILILRKYLEILQKQKTLQNNGKKSWEFWNIDENTRLAQRKHRPNNNTGSEIYPVNKRFTTHLKQIFVQTSENIHLIFSELKNKLCYSTSHENWRYKSIL